MHSACSSPVNMWDEFCATTTYLTNFTGSSTNNGKTPYKLWYGHKPSLSHLHEIGCHAFTLIPTHNPKIHHRSVPCMLIGYAPHSKAYCLWDSVTNHIFNSFHVSFIELHESPSAPPIPASHSTPNNLTLHPVPPYTIPTYDAPILTSTPNHQLPTSHPTIPLPIHVSSTPPINVSSTSTISHHNNTISLQNNTIPHQNNTISHQNNTVSHQNNTVPHQNNTIPHQNNTVSSTLTVPSLNNTVSHQNNTVPHQNNTVSHQNNSNSQQNNTISPQNNTPAPPIITVTPASNTITPTPYTPLPLLRRSPRLAALQCPSLPDQSLYTHHYDTPLHNFLTEYAPL